LGSDFVERSRASRDFVLSVRMMRPSARPRWKWWRSRWARPVDGVAWANDAVAQKYVRLPAKYNLRLTTVSSPARMSSGNPPTARTSRVL
jgi:hypothetical protein